MEKEGRELVGYGTSIVTFTEGEKFYVLTEEAPEPAGVAKWTHRYVQVDKKEHLARVEELAEKIASSPNVKLVDIIYDKMRQFSLKDLEEIEKALTKEEAKPEPNVRTRVGYCVEIKIGKLMVMNWE